MEVQKEITFSVQMKVSDMFDFLYWHSYHGITGIVNYAFSFAGIAALVAGFGKGNTVITIMLVILALLFTVINPLSLWYKAARQIKQTPMFQKPLQYCFSDSGFTITQEGNSDSAQWEDILFLRETKKNIILYLGAANALVLPKKSYSDQLVEFKKLLQAKIPTLAKKLK